MADLNTFQAFEIPQAWVWGGATFNLGLFSHQTWTDQNGKVHLGAKDRRTLSEPCQLCPGTIVDRVATVTQFLFEPTVLAVDFPDVRISGALFDVNDQYVGDLFGPYRFPSTPNPLAYLDFVLFNRARQARLGQRYWTIEQTKDYVDGRLDVSWALAAGRATLVDGTATVATSEVEADSIINLTAHDPNLGVPRVGVIVPGVSFQIVSTDGGDAGDVSWSILAPV